MTIKENLPKGVFLVGIFLVLFSAFAGAVTLAGTIYDSSLRPVQGAVVEISFPRQVAVAVNGSYSFEVSPGPLTIKARKEINSEEFTATENLTIGAENTRFDLVLLLPTNIADIEDIAATLSSTQDTTTQTQEPLAAPVPLWLFVVGLIAVAAIVFAIAWKLKQQQQPRPATVEKIEKIIEKTPEVQLPRVETPKLQIETAQPAEINEFKRQIIELLEKKGGAADQKELRRELPWSEARVSIELTELEKMGKIKKIKRGRANLVKIV